MWTSHNERPHTAIGGIFPKQKKYYLPKSLLLASIKNGRVHFDAAMILENQTYSMDDNDDEHSINRRHRVCWSKIN